MPYLNIGRAAAAAGVTTRMVRHCESPGLIPGAGRTDSGYRLYGEQAVGMLRSTPGAAHAPMAWSHAAAATAA